jgi:hypothetical protein
MTLSFLLSHERPGMPDSPLKLPAPLREYFQAGKPIDEECGASLAAWAAGGAAETPETSAEYITESQLADLEALMDEVKADREQFRRYFAIKGEALLPKSKYSTAIRMLESKRKSTA